jgi:hypothetical protein
MTPYEIARFCEDNLNLPKANRTPIFGKLRSILRDSFRGKTVDDWRAFLESIGCLCSPVIKSQSYDEVTREIGRLSSFFEDSLFIIFHSKESDEKQESLLCCVPLPVAVHIVTLGAVPF